MMRTREERIRTFMQLELEACLEEANWMIRCHNCEALNFPQEEYPARLLPTPAPSYVVNLQSRLIKVRKGIFPASLKTRSTFGGRRCNKFVPVLGGNGREKAPTGDVFDQPPGQMR